MPNVRALISAHTTGDRRSLVALGEALAASVADTPSLPIDPVEVLDQGETSGGEAPGTWLEVRAARDFGDLTEAEYDYLVAAVGHHGTTTGGTR